MSEPKWLPNTRCPKCSIPIQWPSDRFRVEMGKFNAVRIEEMYFIASIPRTIDLCSNCGIKFHVIQEEFLNSNQDKPEALGRGKPDPDHDATKPMLPVVSTQTELDHFTD